MYVVGNTDEVEAAWKPYDGSFPRRQSHTNHTTTRTRGLRTGGPEDQGTEKHGNDQPWPDIWLLNVGS
jgi:hypothetical protein